MAANKPHGHYCRICQQYRANEKFSGRGHAAHICKDCHRRGNKPPEAKPDPPQFVDAGSYLYALINDELPNGIRRCAEISKLEDNQMVMVDRGRIMQRLVEAQSNEDEETIRIIESALNDMIRLSGRDIMLRGPIMSGETLKKVFPDHESNPPLYWEVG